MPTNYPLVSGVILFTSYVLFITLFWLVYLIRPGLFQRRGWIIVLFILVAMHADIFNFSMSWFVHGYPGIEADYSVPTPLYRNFSPKLAALTAPQHTLFLIALTIYLGLRQFLKFPLSAAPMADALIPIMVVISPILTILFLPFSMLIDGVQILRQHSWQTAISYAIKAVGLT